MKTEIKKEEKNRRSVIIVRRGFDNYIPIQDINECLNVEFEEGSEITNDDLIVKSLEVTQKDDTEMSMKCIHFDSVEKYLKLLNEQSKVEQELMVKLLFLIHNYHLIYEKELINSID
jgi:hypothetical protein